MTYTLVGLSVAVFALQFVLPGLTQSFGYSPLYTLAEPWRMLTSAFLHSQSFFLHIAFNMYILWLIGNSLEPLLGRIRFLALYLISAFGGSVGVLLLSPVTTLVIGASGAVFGLFGALFVVQRQRGGDVRQLVILIAINAVLGFVVPNIAWQAHLGGLVAGGLAAAVLAYAPRGKNRTLVQTAGLIGVVVLLVAIGAARIWL
ncbi:rhomboid family intramembrane serine protease [Arthrobacter pigmenti]